MVDLQQSQVFRILVVDDEKTVAAIIRVLLKEKFSAEVTMAHDCASAREQMGSSTFDLITFDYQLPDGDGLELLAELNSREDHPPAIMVTGHGDEQTAVEAFKLGAAGYVVKDHRMRILLVEEAERAIGFAQAVSELKESEQHLRMLTGAMLDVISQHDSHLRFLYASPSIERMFGYRPEELTGRASGDLFHPEDRKMVFSASAEAIKRQAPSVKLLYRFRHKNGEYRWVSSNCRLLYDEEGVFSSSVVSTRDITDRKRADELVLVQRDMAVELGEVTEPSRVIEIALDAALASSGLEAGGVYVADRGTGALDLVNHKGLSPEFVEAVAHFDRTSPTANIVFAGELVYTQHAHLLPLDEIRKKEGHHFIGIVPLHYEGEVVGCLNIASNVLDDIPDQAKSAVEALAGFIGQAVGRSRLLSALKESEERYRLLYESISVPIYTYDRDLVLTDINKKACEILGYSRDEMLGRNVPALSILHPDDIENAAKDIQKLFSGDDIVRDEYRFILKDGSVRIGDVTGAVLRDASGEIVGVTNVVIDITEEKLAMEALTASEGLYRALVATSPDFITLLDIEGNVLALSEGAFEVFGVTADSAHGKSIIKMLDRSQRDTAYRSLEELMEKGVFRGVEFELTAADGSTVVIESSASLIHDSKGEPRVIMSVSRDITDRKKAEEELRLSEERYKALFDQAPVGVVVFDRDLKVTQCNERMAEAMRTTRDRLIGLDLNELKDKRVLHVALEALEGRTAVYEGPYEVTTSGESIHIIAILNPLRDMEGRVVGGIAVVDDVTDRVRTDESLQRANEELRVYAHTVSHDLKGPLSATVTAAELLRDSLKSDNPDRCSELADIIVRLLRKTCSRIDELLVLAQAGQQPVEPVDVSVCSIVGDVLRDLESLIEDRQATVTCDPDLGVVLGNTTQIYQVFSNLVRNALKHGEGDDLTVEVRYLGKDEDGPHRYLVRDNGPGIPPGMEEDIFRPFLKGTQTGETGLGLSIVERIVAAYGGEIKAYNDNGACFEFTLNSFGGHSSRGQAP